MRQASGGLWAVPADLAGCRTLFTALHHPRPPEVRAFLRDTAERRVPLAVFEFTERRWRTVLGMALWPLLVWTQTPALRPRSWARWVRTYLVPVTPAVYAWDGLVSHLRSYTVDELRALAESVGTDGYRLDVGDVGAGRGRITYALGVPTGTGRPPPPG